MSTRTYGLPPEVFEAWHFSDEEKLDLSRLWTEYMHYLYLPVVMRHWDVGDVLVHGHIRLPPNLEFLRPVIEAVCDREQVVDDDDTGLAHQYVYVTARRGYAAPGNPLNRPGWHADGFGSDDVNFIWSDRWPTRFATGKFVDISDDHIRSAGQFEDQVEGRSDLCDRCAGYGRLDPLHGGPGHEAFKPEQCVPCPDCPIQVYSGEPNTIYRLTPDVIHSTPIIDPPGGDRSFFKVSVSPNRYNLVGNSHNYSFEYDWEMYDRSEVRNDPIKGGGDAGPQST